MRTSQLSAFGRRQLATPRRLDLNALLRDWEPRLRQLVGPNIELRYDLTESATVVYADAGEIQQVVLHLVQNGHDAMPAGGVLTIRTTSLTSAPPGAGFAGPSVCLSIGDTGTGMTEEIRAHLFEPFFTTKGFGRGTGLGLAAVHGIVTQTGGHITVESAPGRGSTFRVYLPLSVSDPGGRLPAASAEPSGRNTILIAEDEPAVRTLVGTVLRANGYTVLEAGDGREALALWEQHGPAVGLLLTDLLMPHLSGVELASRLREQRPDLPAVFMSAYADNELVNQGLRIAGIPFLQKPFRPEALLEVVRQTLGQSSGQAAIPGK
jgi:CheY-like chemotaxis protein